MKIFILPLLMSFSLMSLGQTEVKKPTEASSSFIINAKQALEIVEQEEMQLRSSKFINGNGKNKKEEIQVLPALTETKDTRLASEQKSKTSLKNMPTGTTLFEIMYPNSDTAIFHIESEGKSSFVGSVEVDGASTNKAAYDAGSGDTIDFSKSNLAYTSSDATDFTLNGIKDGGTYTLAVQGTMAGLASFTAEGFIFKSKNNGPTQDSSDTLYTFLVIGNTVYYSMTTGL